jgi:Flp pilus assembly protein TadG
MGRLDLRRGLQVVRKHVPNNRSGEGRGFNLWRLLEDYVRDVQGAVSPMLVLALVPIIGALAMGVEGSNWWLTQRSLQNAADTAALAAAENATTSAAGSGSASSYSVAGCSANPGDFDCEAVAAAGRAGYANGANNVVVYPQYLTSGCPGSTTTCYQVTVTKTVPLYLLPIVGFRGNTTLSSGLAQTVSAVAVAAPTGGAAPPFCIVALGSAAKKNLTINGGPKSDMPGCAIASNGATDCNGLPIDGTIASYAASGDANTCAANGNNKPIPSTISDPYSGLSSDVPSHSCTSYSQVPANPKKDPALNAANQLSGTISGTKVVCGDAQLTGAVTLSAGATLVVVDGQLALNGQTITGTSTNTTTGADGATIIFTGNTNPPITPNPQFVTGSGTVAVNAPTSGTWKGIGLYQDSDTSRVASSSITFAGNTPTLQINGLIYTPNAGVTISGAIGSNNACVGFLADTFTINGTGSVIDEPGCSPITLSGFGGGTKIALVK